MAHISFVAQSSEEEEQLVVTFQKLPIQLTHDVKCFGAHKRMVIQPAKRHMPLEYRLFTAAEKEYAHRFTDGTWATLYITESSEILARYKIDEEDLRMMHLPYREVQLQWGKRKA